MRIIGLRGETMKAVYPIISYPRRICCLLIPDLDINTEGGKIPQASGTMPHPEEREIVTLVDIDFAAYRRANDLRTVRKNVTLPSWLNDLAERNGVNFHRYYRKV